MTSLVSISIGPVQDMIAAARRTSDLYAGSELLVTIVGAAAATFSDPIFPANPSAGGANKILALVDGDPAEAVQHARQAAESRLGEVWSDAWNSLPNSQQTAVDPDRSAEQIDGLLEIAAAWVPCPPNPTDAEYAAARTRVERLLAGRKALRDFHPASGTDAQVPKSPLDPSRAAVLIKRGQRSVPPGVRGRHPLWLKEREGLDAVSLLKRVRGRRPGQTVLSTRDLAQLALGPQSLAARRRSAEAAVGQTVDRDELFEPDFPYYAIVVADGDRMGKLLTVNSGPEQHRAISRRLDEFAEQARSETSRRGGQLVYAGGDDVLALMPLPAVADYTATLAECFELWLAEPTEGEPATLQVDTSRASLSAGIAIVHYLEPLSLGLARARQAERAAKRFRNAVSYALHTRGGAPVRVTQQWGDHTVPAWQSWLSRAEVSRGLPYALRSLARAWPAGASTAGLQAEAQRVFAHSQPHVVSADSPSLPAFAGPQDLEAFCNVLILARFLTGVGVR